MKIGIGIPNQIRDMRADVIPEWARRAEESGFASLGSVGRVAYPGVMDTVALAAAAGATSRIGLISNVLLGPVWPAHLLAKEAQSIDGVSGGRFTLGIGLGGRPDDFVVEGLGPRGTGKRLDRDIETYKSVWRGEAPAGCDNPLVPQGSREVPLLFGGMVQASYHRVARSGRGYIGASVPAHMIAGAFDGVRTAWTEAGREGSPHLVAIAYYAVADIEAGRANVYDYYSTAGADTADFIASAVSGGADVIRKTVSEFEAIGADELILNPTSDDIDEILRVADIVL
ncbi:MULTISPECIES: LLM class flavin-dependent oxidoreductase [unclassified Streptomyces]|uniref:LLM class flavin-dependent oxidoreductase n=1 Tax=unclassified Streptomyces TaxID=2593676 RepID=UPI0005B7E289|nr:MULTISPECIES: LLM class flavin-dependent oxidoreductase [unclassified Streptomyces]ASY34025.1 LLM class flavin-dependent oxidoreductase [Streptomyces sp. CLI2509]MYX18500.1 LLM class flavin-dependent oxidoreductase [Streptomyces sp. SID8380]